MFRKEREQFEKLFAPLCRALPELKLRGLGLGLCEQYREFGADEARALATGLGQQTELERLTLYLWNNSLSGGLSCAPRFAF
ncbi:Nlrc3 [Symbiodinium necroappetens]|uniref:Nlrc3 protein n=1 Tax=Symbiodinium necroappetens TaxID=1628268 RepID=A0A813AHI8_9DINO|nr:Nlrc3 [Symbiodinium necroappetens]